MSALDSSSMAVADTPDFADEEAISDSFICCVCLDVLYKPIVLECGHVSCFWCVHKSMSSIRESHCPICRNAYHHFPTICETLHFLLLKMYPRASKRRGKQIFEEEQRKACFSPQLDGKVPDACDGSNTPHDAKADPKEPATTKSNDMSAEDYDRTSDTVSMADVLCSACKQLLFRPSVLNCGHVYCESCITVPEDEVIICSVCESPHPSQAPSICLQFNNFLEEKFPEEYAVRRKNIEQKQSRFQPKNPAACSSSKKSAKRDIFKAFMSDEDFRPWWNEHGSKIHIGVGCDYCGMYPIVGDRYRCKDCVEQVGFDLCGDCYNTPSKRPGRFNQQHTSDHRFELVNQPDFFRHIMLRLTGGGRQRANGSETPILAITAGEDSQDSSDAALSPQLAADGDEADSMLIGNDTIDGNNTDSARRDE